MWIVDIFYLEYVPNYLKKCHFCRKPPASSIPCLVLFPEGAVGLEPAKYLNIFWQKFTPANNPESASFSRNNARLANQPPSFAGQRFLTRMIFKIHLLLNFGLIHIYKHVFHWTSNNICCCGGSGNWVIPL